MITTAYTPAASPTPEQLRRHLGYQPAYEDDLKRTAGALQKGIMEDVKLMGQRLAEGGGQVDPVVYTTWLVCIQAATDALVVKHDELQARVLNAMYPQPGTE